MACQSTVSPHRGKNGPGFVGVARALAGHPWARPLKLTAGLAHELFRFGHRESHALGEPAVQYHFRIHALCEVRLDGADLAVALTSLPARLLKMVAVVVPLGCADVPAMGLSV